MPKTPLTPTRLLAAAAAGTCALLAVTAGPAAAATVPFRAGDVVVYEVGASGGATPSSTSGAVTLVGYSPAGTVDTTVPLPSTDSGSMHALTESGTAGNDGELSLSADGQALLATGYDAPAGTTSITKAASTPRTVALVGASGSVDTSTALSDSTTEGSASSPNNFRSATALSASGSTMYTGGDGGLGVTSDGASSASYLNSDTVHQVQVVAGQLYESTTTAINAVGAGTPTSGAPADSSLLGAAPPAGFDPDGFALVTIGSAPGPNVAYVADTKAQQIEKYSLADGVWTETGSVAVNTPEGVAASVVGTTVTLYVTDASAAGAKFNNTLQTLTDATGAGGTLAGTPTTLVTAPTGVSFKGVALAPVAPTVAAPEAPTAVVLPVAAVGILAGGGVIRRRRHRRA